MGLWGDGTHSEQFPVGGVSSGVRHEGQGVERQELGGLAKSGTSRLQVLPQLGHVSLLATYTGGDRQ